MTSVDTEYLLNHCDERSSLVVIIMTIVDKMTLFEGRVVIRDSHYLLSLYRSVSMLIVLLDVLCIRLFLMGYISNKYSCYLFK